MTTLVDLTRRAHERYSPHPAVLGDTGWLTFHDLAAAARRIVRALDRAGVRRGDRVVIALGNRPESLMLDHALFRAGLVRVAVSERLHGYEVSDITSDCSAAAAVVEPHHVAPLTKARPSLPSLRTLIAPDAGDITLAELVGSDDDDPGDIPDPGVTPDDVAALMYTSGTTGRPKGAIVTHRGWVAMVRAFWAALPPMQPGDVVLHVAPMSHFGGSAGSAATFRGAAALPVAKFEPERILRLVEQHRVTVLPLVPTMMKELTAAAEHASYDLSSLRAIPYGGSAISAAGAARARDVFGDVLYQCYGLSEALAPLTVLSARDHADARTYPDRLTSAGRPLPEVELVVTDAAGVAVPPGVMGEVRVRGEQVMPGYWRRPEHTAEVLLPDGWLRTGDIGRLDADGYLHLVDRQRDIIVSGGFTIYPSEVERAIAAHPDVDDVIVVGIPHERWGEAVAAVVVPRPGADLSTDDVIKACTDRIAAYKKPVHVEIVAELPVSSTGKPARREIRDRFWQHRDRYVGQ